MESGYVKSKDAKKQVFWIALDLYDVLTAIIFILLWSSGYIFVENGLRYSNPLTFICLRQWIALLVIGLIFLFRPAKFTLSVRQLSIICITGIFALGLYSIFFFYALNNNISPGLLSIILGTQPLATIFIANETMRPTQIFGILLGLMGVSLTVYNHLTLDSTTFLGIASALLSLSCITLGTIFQKKYCSNIPLTTNLFIQYSASTTLVSILCVAFGNITVTWSFDFTLALLWITLVISVGATYLFYALLKQGKATSVTSYLYCVPPITTLMDYLVFHHVLPLVSIMGMILVMSGVVMIHYQPYTAKSVD